MKTNYRLFAAALIGLLIASCAHRPDTRIADLTRDYVAGRISYRRYAERCYAIYLQGPRYHTSGWTWGSDSSSDSSSGNSEADNRHEKETRDKAHADTYHPAPPPAPAGTVSPQPPPPPERNR